MDQATRKVYIEALEQYEKGKVKEAIDGLLKVIKAYPSYADVHNALGLAYSLTGNNAAALESFRKAVQLNPDYIEAYVNMAIIYNEQCQFDEAIKAFQVAANLETREKGFSPQLRAKLANTYAQLGDTYYELQEYRKARDEYAKAVEVSPTFLDIKLKLAKTCIQLNDHAGAEELLINVLSRNHKYVEARTQLGLCRYQQQRFEDARKEWEEVLQIDPVNIKARSYLNMLKEKK